MRAWPPGSAYPGKGEFFHTATSTAEIQKLATPSLAREAAGWSLPLISSVVECLRWFGVEKGAESRN